MHTNFDVNTVSVILSFSVTHSLETIRQDGSRICCSVKKNNWKHLNKVKAFAHKVHLFHPKLLHDKMNTTSCCVSHVYTWLRLNFCLSNIFFKNRFKCLSVCVCVYPKLRQTASRCSGSTGSQEQVVSFNLWFFYSKQWIKQNRQHPKNTPGSIWDNPAAL